MSLYQYLKPTMVKLRDNYAATRMIYELLMPELYSYSQRCPHLFTPEVMEEINQCIIRLDRYKLKEFLKKHRLEYEKSFFSKPYNLDKRLTMTGKEL